MGGMSHYAKKPGVNCPLTIRRCYTCDRRGWFCTLKSYSTYVNKFILYLQFVRFAVTFYIPEIRHFKIIRV